MPSDDVRKTLALAERVKPLFAGHSPDIQGAALAELLSIWLAGFPEEMRETMLTMHIEQMRPLIGVNAKIIRQKN